MQHLKLNFEDISKSNILYYDKKVEEACFDICETLKIDNMPDYDSQHYFELVDKAFYKKEITPDVRLSNQDQIFDETLLEKFTNNKHNVLFVFRGEVLSGIAHFSDYNQTKVLQAIQDDILTFERKMRQYLFLEGYKNKDMMDYFKYRAEKNSSSQKFYWGKIEKLERSSSQMEQLGEFQFFDLKDLLEFGNSSFSNKIFSSKSIEYDSKNNKKEHQINLVCNLRNMAMHGKNPVEKNQETSVYSIESLRYLFTALKTLVSLTHRVDKLVNKHSDYKKSVMMDNQNKLEIIHQHHPKALNYFIDN